MDHGNNKKNMSLVALITPLYRSAYLFVFLADLEIHKDQRGNLLHLRIFSGPEHSEFIHPRDTYLVL